jgi:hypothetical protein
MPAPPEAIGREGGANHKRRKAANVQQVKPGSIAAAPISVIGKTAAIMWGH